MQHDPVAAAAFAATENSWESYLSYSSDSDECNTADDSDSEDDDSDDDGAWALGLPASSVGSNCSCTGDDSSDSTNFEYDDVSDGWLSESGSSDAATEVSWWGTSSSADGWSPDSMLQPDIDIELAGVGDPPVLDERQLEWLEKNPL